jgi:xanthine dehydrogenase small subunit
VRDYVIIYVNGRRHEVRGARAFQSLSDFLRYDLGLTGTKVVCAEGDCGSCTILLGRLERSWEGEAPAEPAPQERRPPEYKIRYRTACSCIQFLSQLDCTHIITVEGLKYDGQLNPVQEAMVTCQASQCGFCTPGFVVSLCAMFEDARENASTNAVKMACIGNLCRCTGYEAIVKAGANVDRSRMRPLARMYPQQPMVADFAQHSRDPVHVGWAPPASSSSTDERWEMPTVPKLFFKPTTIVQAVKFRADHPDCTILAGGTDIGVQMNKFLREAKTILSLSGLTELRAVRVENGAIVAGALASIAQLERISRDALPEYARLLYYFGSPPIKNAGTLGGNIANGSPIGDTMPALYVLNAEIELTGTSGSRRVNINEFYTGYKTNVSTPDELITAIYIPLPVPSDIFKLYKVSKRKDLDISAFTAAIWMRRNGETVTDTRIAYGGVGPNILRLKETEAFFIGKMLSHETIREAGEIARSEISPISDVRGSAEFRAQLGENILRKFYAEITRPGDNGFHSSNGNGDSVAETQNIAQPPLKPSPLGWDRMRNEQTQRHDESD